MNKQGQTLILFVILIPIILIFAALVIDIGMEVLESNKLKETSKTIISQTIKEIDNPNIENKIKDLYIKNNINVDNLNIEIYDNKIHITNNLKIKSIFGGLIGIKEYDIKLNITGYTENNKIIYE